MYAIETREIINESAKENLAALGRQYRPLRHQILVKDGEPVAGFGPWNMDAKVHISKPNRINPTHAVTVQVWVDGRYSMPETWTLPE